MSERIYTVRLGGNVLKEFKNKVEAQAFMLEYVMMQTEHIKQLDYLDEAVLKSDLTEAKVALKHIMEL